MKQLITYSIAYIHIRLSQHTCTLTSLHQEATQVAVPYTLANRQHKTPFRYT